MAFNFRISERTKKHFIDFFQKLFVLYTENKVTFDDSYKKIVFSKPPKCLSIDNYDFKYYPIVLVGISSISSRDCSINKFKDYYTDSIGVVSSVYGGFAETNLNFQIRARSGDERNNLADIVLMYLDSVDVKKTFARDFGIRILGSPSITGESSEDDPQTNVKNFVINLSQKFESDYEEGIDITDTLGNTGLTVSNVVAYTPIVHCKVSSGDTVAPYNTFTADAVSPDTLILVDGYYTGFTLRFTSGTVNNISKKILNFTATTKTFVIEDIGIVIPSNTTFEIRGTS